MKDNIILIGFMGAGKTTVGRYIANHWAMNFADFDEEISKQEKMSINEIFAAHGEKYFRDMEKLTIQRFMGCENFVISTGGGIVKERENVQALRKIGKVIYLKASIQTLFDRIKDSGDRPLLKSPEPFKDFEHIFEERRKNYELADIIINTENKSVEDIVRKIDEKINS